MNGGPMASKRLDKILSEAGIASRKEIKEMIRRNRIAVDGIPAYSSDMKVDEAQSHITLDGEEVRLGAYYIMMNKPDGYVSATEDKNEKTVLDLLPETMKKAGVFPVGRLDKETEGLLLLTNDGVWAHSITSPKKEVKKVYAATVEGVPDQEDIQALLDGVVLKDGTQCKPAKLQVLNDENPCSVLVTVTEGKYHIVRRMMASRGHRVLYLERVAEGGLSLDPTLQRGQWRELTDSELELVHI